MKRMISEWRHVFKLDPDRSISDEHLERICLSGTDAIMIGGSSGVTFDNVVELLSRVRRFSLPCVAEISTPEAVVPGFDLYLVPFVLNAGHTDWLIGLHHRTIKQYGTLPWELIVPEGYIVLNPSATVAQLTEAQTDLDQRDVIAYALLAEQMFHLPILYIEYSGTFGNMEILRDVAAVLKRTQLFYGGGIDGAEKAGQAASYADTIVVGNMIYENIDRALETVLMIR